MRDAKRGNNMLGVLLGPVSQEGTLLCVNRLGAVSSRETGLSAALGRSRLQMDLKAKEQDGQIELHQCRRHEGYRRTNGAPGLHALLSARCEWLSGCSTGQQKRHIAEMINWLSSTLMGRRSQMHILSVLAIVAMGPELPHLV